MSYIVVIKVKEGNIVLLTNNVIVNEAGDMGKAIQGFDSKQKILDLFKGIGLSKDMKVYGVDGPTSSEFKHVYDAQTDSVAEITLISRKKTGAMATVIEGILVNDKILDRDKFDVVKELEVIS